jgi:hypothetical protein
MSRCDSETQIVTTRTVELNDKMKRIFLALCLATPALAFEVTLNALQKQLHPNIRGFLGYSSPGIHRISTPRIVWALKSDAKPSEQKSKAARYSPIKIDSRHVNYLVERMFTGGAVSQFAFLLIVATSFVSGGALLIWLAAFGESTLQFAITKSYMFLFRCPPLPAARGLQTRFKRRRQDPRQQPHGRAHAPRRPDQQPPLQP